MLGGGLSRLRGAVGGKGAERGRMGNWGHGVKSGKTKKTEAGAAELLGLGSVEHVGTRAGVQSTGLGGMPALLPAGRAAGHALAGPCVPFTVAPHSLMHPWPRERSFTREHSFSLDQKFKGLSSTQSQPTQFRK